MTSDRWQLIEGLFVAALDMDRGQQSEFLDKECAGDADLRHEVESLLASHEQASQMLESPAYIFAEGVLSNALDQSDLLRIGPYKLVRKIDEGGMGAVFLATRADNQFNQEVAVKLIKRDFDTEDVRRRFRHERQILANLVHPNIARLLDGGTTPDGRPYLVMEFVLGQPITKYCEKRNLSLPDRLKLFRTVCEAVHFAHQNLVIHRDIKPGNVLVSEDGTPKLLDFGIAKLLDHDSVESDDHSVTMLGAMTPDYASPEQIRREQVTTATDIYSLGVLLYELLSGERPYRLHNRRPDEMASIIFASEPPKPSTAILNTQRKDSTSETRNPKLLRGDLDNIVLMALRKDPERRYASAEQFAEDLRRHQEGLPVLAAPDTLGYLTMKFVGRHRFGVAAASVILLLLLGGVVVTSWQARVAARQRDKANQEEAKARRITRFMQETLGAANPNQEGRDVKVVDVLDKAARRAQQELADQPEVLAEVQRTIGYTYYNLEVYDKSEPLLRSALDTFRATLGENNRNTAECMKQLGEVLGYQEKYDEAIPLLNRAVAIFESTSSTKDNNFVSAKYSLAQAFYFKGDLQQAESLYREVLDYAVKNSGDNNPVIADASHELANLLRDTDYDGAIVLYQQAIRVIRSLPDKKVNLATGLSNLGNVLANAGRLDEAEPALQESLAMRTEMLGEMNPATAIVLANISRVSFARGDFSRAEAEARKSVTVMESALPKGHRNLGPAYTALGRALMKSGKLSEAERYLRDGMAIQAKRSGPEDRGAAIAESSLGECLMLQKNYEQAAPLLRHSHEVLAAKLKANDFALVEAQTRLQELEKRTDH